MPTRLVFIYYKGYYKGRANPAMIGSILWILLLKY